MHEGDNIQVRVTSAEEQDAVLSGLDDIEAIKAIVPLDPDSALTDDEKRLYSLLTGISSPSSTGASLNDLDSVRATRPDSDVSEAISASTEEVVREAAASTNPYDMLVNSLYDFSSGRVVILTLSCLAASLVLGSLVGILYLKHLLCGPSDDPLDNLPRVEKQEVLNTPDDSQSSGGEKLGLLFLDVDVPELNDIVITSEDGTTKEKVIRVNEAYYNQYGYSSDEQESDEPTEKFHEAFASPYMHSNQSLPRISVDYSDPDLLPLPIVSHATPYSTPPHTPPPPALRRLPSQLSMRDSRPSSPLSKPAWSLRAIDAPALGLSASPSPPMMRTISPGPVSRPLPIPGAFVPDEENTVVERPAPRRAYRAPVPELDIAFAMQLRPGLGLGSDPAWLVRFLMAMFGWMTVLIGGNPGAGRADRRALMA